MRPSLLPLLLLLCLALASCQREADNPPSPAEGASPASFRMALDQAPSSIDPLQAAVIYSQFLIVNLYDTPLRYRYLSRPYVLAPNLLESIPEPEAEGLRYTLRIRPGVRYSDDPAFADGRGREVTAADLAFSLRRHFDPANASQGAWLWQGKIRGLDAWASEGADPQASIEGLEVVDAQTLVIHLVEPYPQLPFTLATPFAAVLPPEAIAHYGPEIARKAVGSGPYVLEHFDSARAVLRRNPNYRSEHVDLAAEGYDAILHGPYGIQQIEGRKIPLVERIEIAFLPDAAPRWAAFARGDDLHAIDVPAEVLDQVLQSRNPMSLKPDWAERVHSRTASEFGFIYMTFNMANPEIGHHPDAQEDARRRGLRCAIRAAFDWPARSRVFYNDLAQTFPGVIPPSVPEFDAELPNDSVRNDPDQARALLALHGWSPEQLPTLRYGAPNTIQQRQHFEQLQAWLVALGWPAERLIYQAYPSFGDFSRAIADREVDLISLGWALDYPDAQSALQLFYGPFESPGSNAANYRNEAYDLLYREAAVLPPSEQRTAIYRNLNELLIDDCALVGSLTRQRVSLWHKPVIAWPDRDVVAGFHLRFVALD